MVSVEYIRLSDIFCKALYGKLTQHVNPSRSSSGSVIRTLLCFESLIYAMHLYSENPISQY